MEHIEKLNLTVTNDKRNQKEIDSNNVSTTSPSRNSLVRSVPQRRILQNFRLVWLDSNIEQTKNDVTTNIIDQLRQIVDDLTEFNDIDSCIEFITNIKNEKIFLICSEEYGQSIVPLIHENIQLDAVYIFSSKQSQHSDWIKAWYKIKGIYTDYNSICKALKDAAKICDHNLVPISFVKKTDDGSKQDLNTLDASFMYTQIMKEILLTIEFDQSHINEFLTYCREQFIDNNIQLRNIDQIEKQYSHRQPIWWYTYSYLLYSILNRALRLMEVDIIIKMGFFLKDLHNHICTVHTQQFGEQHHADTFVVYRGQGLSKKDFDELQRTQGGLLSFNSFLSTSSNRAVSFAFAESVQSSPDMVGVLFEITIQPSNSLSPFANVKDISYFKEEEEILFSMHSIFRIEQVKPIEENHQLWQVDLTITTDTDPQLLSLTKSIRIETEGSTGWFRLGQLMVQLAQYDKAEDLYKMLLPETNDEKEQGDIYGQLGGIMFHRREYAKAISTYEKSLQLREKLFTLEHPEVAVCYNNIGLAHSNMGEYPTALSYHHKALEIYQKTFSENHPSLAISHDNIGELHQNMGEYLKTLAYFEKALEIYQKTLPDIHPRLAISYTNIGSVYHNMGEYSKALSYYEKGLEMRQKIFPENHPHWAVSYSNIGLVYRNMGEYSKALLYFEKALEIRQKSLSDDHSDSAQSYDNIGTVYYNLGEYSKALSSHEKSLEILQKNLPDNHLNFARPYTNIGLVYNGIGEYSKALSYFEKALKIRQKSLSDDHPDLAQSYDNIGLVYQNLGEYSKALSFFEQALEIFQKNPSKNHPNWATSYSNIGLVYRNMGEYSKALSYYEKGLEMRQKIFPENHPHFIQSYNNIGSVYNNMEEYSKALSFYEQTLEISKKTLPENHPHLANFYNNIGSVYDNMGKYSEALSSHEKALEILQKTLRESHPHFAISYNNIGSVCKNMGEDSKALLYYKQALEIRQKNLPDDHPDFAKSYNNIGWVYKNMEEYSKALSYYERALDILQHSFPSNHPDIKTVKDRIESVKKRL